MREDLKVHRQFVDKNPFHGLEAHYADTALDTPKERTSSDNKSGKGKKTLAIVPTKGRTIVKDY